MASSEVDSRQRRGRGRPKGTGVVDPVDILENALDAIADGGYGGLSMRAVGRSLGVSLATVQHHFGTKAELWTAAIDHFFGSIDERRPGASDQDLASRIRTMLDVSGDRPGFLATLLGDRSEGYEARLVLIADRLNQLFAEPIKTLTRMESRGQLRPIDPVALCLLTSVGIGTIAGAPDAVRSIFGFNLIDPNERDRLASVFADIIQHGILTEPYRNAQTSTLF